MTPVLASARRTRRPVARARLAAVRMPSTTFSALVVATDPVRRRELLDQLAAYGHPAVELGAVEDLATFDGGAPIDVVLVSVDLVLDPDAGIDAIRRLRAWTTTPLLVLSPRRRELDKVSALDAGADDYLAEPVGRRELMARIRSAMRRTRAALPDTAPVIEVGPLRIDPAAQEVTLAGKVVPMTRIELRVLIALADNAGRVLTSEQLAQAAWGPGPKEQRHSVRGYVARIRHKLEVDPARPRWLVTKQRVGYCLRRDPERD